MAALIVFAFLIISGFTFIIIRISVSCMFWFSKNPNDKMYVFKTLFPYYILVLFGLGITAIIAFNFEILLICYCICTYVLALLIWNFKLNRCKRKYSTTETIIEPQIPNLP